MQPSNHASNELNSLLRGEISALESYQIALKELDPAQCASLRPIVEDHQVAVNELSAAVRNAGKEPSSSSGPWGTFAKAVTGTSTGLGDKAVLKALKEGEEHGIKVYESALDDKAFDTTVQATIRSKLLPRQRAHIQTLDACMNNLN